jgi:hypothetical protein
MLYESYYRQYFGFLANGKKYIYVTAFCFKPDCFLTTSCSYKGGGNCFFQVLVDINNKKAGVFHFNAPK